MWLLTVLYLKNTECGWSLMANELALACKCNVKIIPYVMIWGFSKEIK
jgi:hypothetical protein